jgi:hypothetical protein
MWAVCLIDRSSMPAGMRCMRVSASSGSDRTMLSLSEGLDSSSVSVLAVSSVMVLASDRGGAGAMAWGAGAPTGTGAATCSRTGADAYSIRHWCTKKGACMLDACACRKVRNEAVVVTVC